VTALPVPRPRGLAIDLSAMAPALIALAIAAAAMWASPILNDGDTYWHVATGAWMLDHQAMVRVDPFSHSAPGQAWTAHEWLSEILMALSWRAAGWQGVMALFGAATGALALILLTILRRRLTLAVCAVILVLVLACVGPSLLARPHVLAWPVMAAWVAALLDARDRGAAPRPMLLLLMVLWANLHGSFVLGLALIGPFALEALLERREDRWLVLRGWGLFGLAAVAAACVTPHGLHGLIYPFQLMGMALTPTIHEWHSADFSQLTAFELTLLAGLYVCLSRRPRIEPLRLILLLGLLHLSLAHVRHQPVFVIIAALVLAGPLAQTARVFCEPPRRLQAAALGVLASLAVVVLALRLSAPVVLADRPMVPVTALSRVPAELRRQPVLNDYGFGGYLIHSGVRPFVDGRADMYGDAFIAAYDAAVRPDPAALEALLSRYRITWTLLRPDNPAVAVLDRDPRWARSWSDPYAVVHIRRTP
jgi:hypothetical protein